MSTDCLTGLFNSRNWVKRRVDRVEFIDLFTARRTITVTLDLAAFDRACHPRQSWIPLGWVIPWANAGAVLVDQEQQTIPYLTSEESDDLVEQAIEGRLRRLDLLPCDLLAAIREHRSDPGLPGVGCNRCEDAAEKDERWTELMSDKWGCPAIVPLLVRLHGLDAEKEDIEVRQLAAAILAWQTNFVLFARRDASQPPGAWATLQLSYDEELKPWEPPWERRHRTGVNDEDLRPNEARECRKLISRGGPFHADWNVLYPSHGLRRFFTARKHCKRSPLRKWGRRGLLGLAWHVAWHQASGLNVSNQQVDVVLPSELAVVRVRMIRSRAKKCPAENCKVVAGDRRATVADQVGARATIVAPTFPRRPDDISSPPLPTLFSLVITQRSPSSWYGGAWLALVTGIALFIVARSWMTEVVHHASAGITILVLGPTLVSGVLSVRAASDIAEELARAARYLIAAIGVLTAICAISLVISSDADRLQCLWIGIAGALVLIAVILWYGGQRIKRLLRFGHRPSRRRVKDASPGRVLNPPELPWVPPPDRVLATAEGDLVPWGWLHPFYENPSWADRCFWETTDADREKLVRWIQCIFRYSDRTSPEPRHPSGY